MVSARDGLLGAEQRRSPISASLMREGEIIMDAAPQRRLDRAREGIPEIGDGFREATRIVAENATVQERVRELRVDLQGVAVIAESLVGTPQGLGREGSVEIARGGFRVESDAHAEGSPSVLIFLQIVVTKPFIEVRPEIMRPRFEGTPEFRRGGGESSGSHVRASEVIMLRRRSGCRIGLTVGFDLARVMRDRPTKAVDREA